LIKRNSSSVVIGLAAIALVACSESGATTKDQPLPPTNDTVTAAPPSKEMSPDIAKFFAAMKVDSKCPNDTTCVYLQTFINGATREITLRVSPGQAGGTGAGTPGNAPISGFSFARSADPDSTVSIDLNYYVGKAGLPRRPAKVGQGFGLVRLASYSANFAQAGGAGIYWGEVGKKGADVSIGALLDYAKENGVKAGPIGSIYSLASSLSDVSEALDLSRQHAKWLKELDALEKCAANPTNRLAITEPNYQRNTVAKIRAARGELTEVTGVRFLNKMTEKGADLTPVTAVMSVGLKDGFAWSEQTLGDYSENTIMREARLAVVKCGDPGNASGNLDMVSECQAGPNDHTVSHITADVSWEWQMGVKYIPRGNYKYSSIRKVGTAGCTITSTAAGSIDDTGYLFVFNDPAQIKAQGYGYEARFVNWPAKVTIVAAAVSSCGISATLPTDIDWIPVMRGYLGTGGSISGEMPGPACSQGQPSTLKWSFSVPAAKK
jgi:hypothetical protein